MTNLPFDDGSPTGRTVYGARAGALLVLVGGAMVATVGGVALARAATPLVGVGFAIVADAYLLAKLRPRVVSGKAPGMFRSRRERRESIRAKERLRPEIEKALATAPTHVTLTLTERRGLRLRRARVPGYVLPPMRSRSGELDLRLLLIEPLPGGSSEVLVPYRMIRSIALTPRPTEPRPRRPAPEHQAEKPTVIDLRNDVQHAESSWF